MYVLDRDIELHRNESAHSRGIEDPRHANHPLAREFGQSIERLGHGVERIGDWNDDAVRTMLDEPRRDALHDLEIVADEIVAAHPWLSRFTRGDDDDVRS